MGDSVDEAGSGLREWRSRRSRTGVAWSLRWVMAPATVTGERVVVRRALGMPRFSARLLAIEGWGRRRREAGGDEGCEGEVVVGEVAVMGAAGVGVVEAVSGLLAAAGVLRGASLIRPASLRWWSSSRVRMRRASGLDVSRAASWKRRAAVLVAGGGYAMGKRGRGRAADVVVGSREGSGLHGGMLGWGGWCGVVWCGMGGVGYGSEE